MKNTRKKKILSFVLTLALIIGILPVYTLNFAPKARADTWNGSVPGSATGFSNNHITSAAGFVWFIKTISNGTDYNGQTVYLDVDVDLNNFNFADKYDFSSYDGKIFKGTFNGQEHTISNLKIEASNKHRVALFRTTENATFRNINFNNVSISSSGSYNGNAVLVGYHAAGNLTFENVHVNSGSISGHNYIAGLAGEVGANSGDKVTLTNCSNAATITCRNVRGGGLVGSSLPAVVATNCTNTGNVTGSSTDMGGIVGWIEDDASLFSCCYNSGEIRGTDSVGGILGYFGNDSLDQRLTIENNTNTGNVVCPNNRAGGIVGLIDTDNNAHIISGNINRGNISGGTDAGGIVARNKGFGIWSYNVNYGAVTGSSDNAGGICGEIEDDRQNFEYCENYGAIQGKNSTGGIIGWGDNGSQYFTNCYNSGSVTATGSSSYAGGILAGGKQEVSCTECFNIGTIKGDGDSGGLVGHVAYHTFYTRCWNAGTVRYNSNSGTGNSYGGMIGYTSYYGNDPTNQVMIVDCYNWGSITGGYVGGFVGYVDSQKAYLVTYSYNTGTLSGSKAAWQFVGYGGSCGSQCFKNVNTGSGTYKTNQQFIDYNSSGFPIDANFIKNSGVTINGTTYYFPILGCFDTAFFETHFQDGSRCFHDDNWTAHYSNNALYYTCATCGKRLDSECPITSLNTTALPTASGGKLNNGVIYNVASSKTISGSSSSNGLIVSNNAVVVIHIPSGVTLTVNGGDASGSTSGKAGIFVPGTSKLIIIGGGSLVANAGDGANGANGSSGHDDKGGAGGAGGGGGGAAIGGNGGNGGNGGSAGDNNSGSGWSGGNGGNGSHGYSGGKIYVLNTVTVTTENGSDGSGGYGGGQGSGSQSGGGGGGGGKGYAGEPLGGGGCGGGGGGGGSAGGYDWGNKKGEAGKGGNNEGRNGTDGGGSHKYSSGSGGASGVNGRSSDYANGLSASDARVAKYITRFVFLNKQDGQNNPDVKKCYIGSAMPSMTIPTKTGYTFSGYFSAKNGGGTKYYNADGSSAHVVDFETGELYAKWTANTYTVTYDGGGATSGSTANSTHTYDSAKNLTSNGFSRAYTVTYNHNYSGSTDTSDTATYSFNGWQGSRQLIHDENEYSYDNTNGSSYHEVKQWTIASPFAENDVYVLEFDAKGSGVVTNYFYGASGYKTVSSSVSATGASHVGGGDGDIRHALSSSYKHFKITWTLSSSGDGNVNKYVLFRALAGSSVTIKNVSFYKLSPGATDYNNSQSVTNLMSENNSFYQMVAKWNSASVSLESPSRTGYTFTGWYKESGCTTSVGAGGASYTPTANITLYANWSIHHSSLTVKPNGGEYNDSSNDTSYTSRDYNSTQSIADPVKTGYTFGGWTLGGDRNGSISNGTYTFGPADGTTDTLTASWSANPYKVAFAPGDGSGTMGNQSFTYDEAQKALTSNAFTAPSYTVSFNSNGGTSSGSLTATGSFKEWSGSDGITYTDGQKVQNLTSVYNGTVTMTAQWNLGSITLPTPTKDNYVIEGWYSDSGLTANTKVGKGGDSYTPTASGTLYAKWADIKADNSEVKGSYDSSTTITTVKPLYEAKLTKPDGLVLNSKAYTTAQLDSAVSGTRTFSDAEGVFTVNSTNNTIFFDPAVSWHTAATIYYGQKTTVNATDYYTYAKYVATPDTNLSFGETKLAKTGNWTEMTSTVTSVNNADSTAYGFDLHYKTKSLYSDGTAYKVTVSKTSTGAWPTMTFDFWGTGVDIIGRCDDHTGLITAKVTPYGSNTVVTVGEKKMTAAINTYYKDSTYSALCQTPVIHFDGLPYAHYSVLITASYSAFFDKTGTQSFGDIELDGIDEAETANERYSGPDLAKLLGDPDFAGVEVQSVMPDEPAFNVAGNAAGSGSYNVFVDGIRIYNPAGVNLSSASGIGKTYADDNELNPTYTLMSTNIRTNTSAQAISLEGQIGSIYVEQGEQGSGLAAYNKAGPLNEVYLATNQTVAFKVASYSSSTKVHVALRNVSQTGAPKASINSGAALVINSNTEMYYDVSAQVTGQGIVTITNTGDGLLGIGNVKIIRSGASGQSTGDIELDGFEIELDSTEPAGAEIYVDAETLEYALSAAPTANSMPDAENVTFPVTFVKANGERVTASVTVPATKFNYSQKADGTWVAIANLKVSDALITKAMKEAGLEDYEASTEDGRVYLTARAKSGEWQAQAAEINVTLNKQERANRWIDLLALIRQILTHLFSLILLK